MRAPVKYECHAKKVVVQGRKGHDQHTIQAASAGRHWLCARMSHFASFVRKETVVTAIGGGEKLGSGTSEEPGDHGRRGISRSRSRYRRPFPSPSPFFPPPDTRDVSPVHGATCSGKRRRPTAKKERGRVTAGDTDHERRNRNNPLLPPPKLPSPLSLPSSSLDVSSNCSPTSPADALDAGRTATTIGSSIEFVWWHRQPSTHVVPTRSQLRLVCVAPADGALPFRPVATGKARAPSAVRLCFFFLGRLGKSKNSKSDFSKLRKLKLSFSRVGNPNPGGEK